MHRIALLNPRPPQRAGPNPVVRTRVRVREDGLPHPVARLREKVKTKAKEGKTERRAKANAREPLTHGKKSMRAQLAIAIPLRYNHQSPPVSG